jgi:hypothetical protein
LFNKNDIYMETKKLNVLITGSTGMVGEGVLLTCLDHALIEKITVINRRPLGFSHPKLTEIIHGNFFDLSPIEDRLTGFDACYFCLGLSSIGVSEADYYQVTYVLTMHVGETLSRMNPNMVFCYVAGAGTDETERSNMSWARVKGKTENDLEKLPFKALYRYRFGFVKPVPGQIHTKPFYRYINWVLPVGKSLYPEGFNSLDEVALSMIYVTLYGSAEKKLAGRAITLQADKMKYLL